MSIAFLSGAAGICFYFHGVGQWRQLETPVICKHSSIVSAQSERTPEKGKLLSVFSFCGTTFESDHLCCLYKTEELLLIEFSQLCSRILQLNPLGTPDRTACHMPGSQWESPPLFSSFYAGQWSPHCLLGSPQSPRSACNSDSRLMSKL